MGEYLIQIKGSNVPIKLNGKTEQYNDGDWVKVGKLTAMALIDDNKAIMQNPKELIDPEGIVVYAPESELHEVTLFVDVPTVGMNPDTKITDTYNLFMDKGYCFKQKNAPGLIRNPSRFAQFFEVLHDFDVALILRDYVKTVKDYGREIVVTQDIVGDMRIMSYQTCCVGIANSKNGRAFYEAWQKENERGDYQALVRALFQVKPTVYYFTPEWGIV